jgi:hypothetical protein
MIKLAISEPKSAAWKKWRADCKRRTNSDIRSYRPGKSVKITELYKREKTFFTDSSGPFKAKCAFCETSISNHYGDVDHYRPKGGVQDRNRKWVRIRVGTKTIRHPGYFWLAYDWENLIPSCSGCNRFQHGVGKSNCFPVEGAYATKRGQERKEKPLLLNPRIDDPEQHIDFDNNWFARPLTERGRLTIEIIGLNHKDLPRHRTREAQQTERVILVELAQLNRHTRQSLKNEIDKIADSGEQFVAVRRKVVAEYRGRLRGFFD